MSKEWKDGIPPVGCECEYTFGACVAWYKMTYHGKTAMGEYLIEKSNGAGDIVEKVKFRPTQTQADKEREEAIEAMFDAALGSTGCNDTCTQLYDAGYRLPVEQGEVVSADYLRREWLLVPSTIDWAAYLDKDYIITRKPNV
jgi:hypothetical protein